MFLFIKCILNTSQIFSSPKKLSHRSFDSIPAIDMILICIKTFLKDEYQLEKLLHSFKRAYNEGKHMILSNKTTRKKYVSFLQARKLFLFKDLDLKLEKLLVVLFYFNQKSENDKTFKIFKESKNILRSISLLFKKLTEEQKSIIVHSIYFIEKIEEILQNMKEIYDEFIFLSNVEINLKENFFNKVQNFVISRLYEYKERYSL